jgi:lactoylglutathione lyase
VTRFREPFPIVYVEDVESAVDFYVSSFGFEVGFRWPAEGALSFAFLKLEPLGIGIGSRHEHSVGDFELCIYTDDVDAAAARLGAAGADEVMAPRDEPWGERRAYFHGPDGTLLHVVAPL